MKAKKNFILIFIICCIICSAFAHKAAALNTGRAETVVDIPEGFKELLERGMLTFKAPVMKITDVKDDPLMKYDIAYLDEANGFEIRINIVPLDSGGSQKENLDILTLAKEGSYEAIDLKHLMFNAEKAGLGEFLFEKKYDGYKKGCILFIHKNKHASVYVFYLGNDSEKFSGMVMDNLFILKFNE